MQLYYNQPLATLWLTYEFSQSATVYKDTSLDKPAVCPSAIEM